MNIKKYLNSDKYKLIISVCLFLGYFFAYFMISKDSGYNLEDEDVLRNSLRKLVASEQKINGYIRLNLADENIFMDIIIDGDVDMKNEKVNMNMFIQEEKIRISLDKAMLIISSSLGEKEFDTGESLCRSLRSIDNLAVKNVSKKTVQKGVSIIDTSIYELEAINLIPEELMKELELFIGSDVEADFSKGYLNVYVKNQNDVERIHFRALGNAINGEINFR